MNRKLIEEIVELTRDLIAIPSSHSRPEEIHRCAHFIQQWLTRHDIRCHRFESNNIPSLCVTPGEKWSSELVINAHFDVVECENQALFHPFEKDGRLHGRGAVDDKYAVALSLVLFREHLQRLRSCGKDQPDMIFSLLLTGDEEVGGANGMAKLAENVTTSFFIVLDGGQPDLIVTKEKGILQLRLEAKGVSAHAARPWLGQSAFDLLIEDYMRIKQLFPQSAPSYWHKTMVLSQCQAGSGSHNMVPQNASATLDIRYTEEEDPDALVELIRASIQGTLKVLAQEPVFNSGSSPYLDLIQSCCDNVAFTCEHGASDARYLSKRGIPGIIWGADGQLTQHTEDEFLVIDSLKPLYSNLNNFIHAVEDGLKKDQLSEKFSSLRN